jgi:hypothetical protein
MERSYSKYERNDAARTRAGQSSAPLPKFVIRCSTLRHELRKQWGTGESMFLVPLFDLKFQEEIAARGAGTSNRRHLVCLLLVADHVKRAGDLALESAPPDQGFLASVGHPDFGRIDLVDSRGQLIPVGMV